MRKFILPFLLLGIFAACNNEKAADVSSDSTKDSTARKPQAEFADLKYVDMGKKALQQFASGDYDNWGTMFADNAVYQYSNGDSIAGRGAIISYWKDRRAKYIDSLSATNDIWLAVKVNESQRGPDLPGVWLMNWHQVTTKYKSGKTISFWVHIDFHYNDADQVDRVVAYVDQAPINAAIAGK